MEVIQRQLLHKAREESRYLLIRHKYFIDDKNQISLGAAACNFFIEMGENMRYSAPELRFALNDIMANIHRLEAHELLDILQHYAANHAQVVLIQHWLGALRRAYLEQLLPQLLILQLPRPPHDLKLPSFLFVVPDVVKQVRYLVYLRNTELYARLFDEQEVLWRVDELLRAVAAMELRLAQPVYALADVARRLGELLDMAIQRPLGRIATDGGAAPVVEIKLRLIGRLLALNTIEITRAPWKHHRIGDRIALFRGGDFAIQPEFRLNEQQQRLHATLLANTELINALQFDERELQIFDSMAHLAVRLDLTCRHATQLHGDFQLAARRRRRDERVGQLRNSAPLEYVQDNARGIHCGLHRLHMLINALLCISNEHFQRAATSHNIKLLDANFNALGHILLIAEQIIEVYSFCTQRFQELTGDQMSQISHVIRCKFQEASNLTRGVPGLGAW